MSEIVLERLLASADAALEREDFKAAIALYRRCLLSSTSAVEHAIGKLATAEPAEQAQFWQSVLQAYPHRVEVWLVAGAHSADPVTHYTAMLDHFAYVSPILYDRIRLHRLGAACAADAARHQRIIREDFEYLWFHTAMRAQTLEQIDAHLHGERVIPVLEALLRLDNLPEPLMRFLRLRIEQIRLLEQLTQG